MIDVGVQEDFIEERYTIAIVDSRARRGSMQMGVPIVREGYIPQECPFTACAYTPAGGSVRRLLRSRNDPLIDSILK